VVTEQLDHLVLNLTKPSRNRPGLVGGWVRPDVVMGGLAACRQAGEPLGRGRRDMQRVAGRFGPVRAVHRDHQADPASSDPAVGAVLYGTGDTREGIAAFVAKRKPRFGGH
jgi:hypothetical protein